MATFPQLSSGAVAQYPTGMVSSQGVQVIRFLDGTDQRFLSQPRALRQWQIQLDLLNEAEIAEVEAFFDETQGDASSFTFPDPISGSPVSNCYLASPSMASQYIGVDHSAASLWVIEAYEQSSVSST
jgi:hypothetical protein